MIFFNNTNELDKSLETEKNFFNYNLKSQENLKNIILNYMQNFSNSTNNINSTYANQIMNILDSLKNSLELCNKNINNYELFLGNLNKINEFYKNNDENLNTEINNFNQNYNDLNKNIMENTIKIEECINNISKESELRFSSISTETIESTPIIQQLPQDSIDFSEKVSENVSQNSEESEQKKYNSFSYTENTLVVSETTQNVTLPFKITDLNEILKNEPNKYNSIDDVITKKYTLPLKNFKNPTVSRFKQGFKLMREKEHSSFRQAFDLGMELIFDSNLHPAIIPACDNLETLDNYLYCLENKQTEKFNRFNIVFECPPLSK